MPCFGTARDILSALSRADDHAAPLVSSGTIQYLRRLAVRGARADVGRGLRESLNT